MCIGGIIGKMRNVVENWHNTGTVTGTDEVGAVCGMDAYDVLTNCYHCRQRNRQIRRQHFQNRRRIRQRRSSSPVERQHIGRRKHFPPEPGQRRADRCDPGSGQRPRCGLRSERFAQVGQATPTMKITSEIHAWDDNGFCKMTTPPPAGDK